jgi:NAD(P)-dependent dehydrogenase (short-subunit alcohol dehydrogenase family)
LARLAGKVAIVTGAGQGIGRGIARAMAREGALVTLVGRTREKLDAVAQELAELGEPGLVVVCDVARREEAERAVATTAEERGGIDVLVNNAHDLEHVEVPFVDTTDDQLMSHLGSGLFGTVYFMQAAYPHLRERRGSVINFASPSSLLGQANMAAYCAAKEAIRGLTRAVAREWGPDGIRVNAIAPAAWDTPHTLAWAETKGGEEYRLQAASRVPLRRTGRSEEDIGAVAVYLASDDACYVTGHTMPVDGGYSIDAGR